jgi:hypothetical protein
MNTADSGQKLFHAPAAELCVDPASLPLKMPLAGASKVGETGMRKLIFAAVAVAILALASPAERAAAMTPAQLGEVTADGGLVQKAAVHCRYGRCWHRHYWAWPFPPLPRIHIWIRPWPGPWGWRGWHYHRHWHHHP